MGTNKTKILFVFLWITFSLNVFAFSRFGNFEPITIAEGLNNNTVYNIIRGQKGYIWLSTDMGISRYDGFHFRNFPYIPQTDSVGSSLKPLPKAVSRIYSNGDNLLYLLLQEGGIACFDIEKECYLPVRFARPIDKNEINSIYIAGKDILYIATDNGLYSAEVKYTNESGKEYILISQSSTPLVKGNISMLNGDDKGSLFFCINGNTVVHYSMGTQQTKIIKTVGNPNSPITTLYVHENHLWICRKWENLVFYDYNRESLRTLSNSSEGKFAISDTYVTEITNVDPNTFYIATRAGLYYIKFEDKAICDSPYTIEYITQQDRTNHFSIEGKMSSLLWDNSQNILWIGTFGGGAIKVGFNEDVYNRITQQLGVEINGIEEDSKGYIWFATERKGVWRSTTSTLTSSSVFAPWTKGVNTSESYQIYKDKNGNIWLGDEHAGITYIDPQTGEPQHYQLRPKEVNNFSGNALRFCLDSRDRLWIATTQGLILFDIKTGESSLPIKLEADIKEITAVAEDKEGDIWVGTNIGAKQIDMQAGKIVLKGEYEQQAGLQPSTVSSIYVNSYNQIFISYMDKIIRIDGREKDKIETVFTLNDGLSSGHIFCMIDDYNGNTWVGSNSGIMTIRNDRTSFYNYSLSGYCNNVCRLRNGYLLWSDSWGLIFFDPMIAKNRQSQKQLLLSDLWVNGKTVAVGEKINGQIVLNFAPDCQEAFTFNTSNNDICFYFSDMQYGMMQRKIAYRLLPDDEWKMCSLEEGIHFANFKSGKYSLQVKLVYPDASEGNVLEVPIVVKEYWWKTIWAILGYIVLAGGICIAVYYYLQQKGKRKIVYANREASLHQKLGQVKQEQEQSEKKNEVRNIVATRFIEEMRTPLSLIIAPLREVLQEKELSKGLSTKMLVAYRNSMGMLNSCDQLLSIYGYVPKTEVELAPYSIVKLTDAFVFSMNEYLRVHPIEFQFEKKVKKDLEVWVDKKALLLVLHNMLSNAFIHIRYAGVVAMLLQETSEDDVHYCTISVIDNGKVMVKTIEELELDIEKLAQIDSAEVELGYSMMEEIMRQHHGNVSIENVKGGGTKVQIKFPVDKAIFEQDKNVTFINPEEQENIKLPEQAVSIKTSELEEEMILLEEELTHPSPDRTRKTILVIEDYKDIRLYLKTLFEREYDIILAVNGMEGVEIARKELPDLIISDVMMPLKDGFECCKELKEGLDTCHIPIILLTAKVEDDDIIKGLEIGADDYILKPFTPKILKVKVKNLIEGRVNLKKMYTKLLVTPPEESTVSEANAKKAEIEDPFISTVVKIIEENIQEPDFNVKKLASDLNMSQPTLYRKVKQCTDFTIIELIRGVRMRKAAILLKKKIYPVQEVAEMVGYNDIPTFRKHFVDTYGTTPSTFADSDAAENINA